MWRMYESYRNQLWVEYKAWSGHIYRPQSEDKLKKEAAEDSSSQSATTPTEKVKYWRNGQENYKRTQREIRMSPQLWRHRILCDTTRHTHGSPLITLVTPTRTKKCPACQPRQLKIKLTQGASLRQTRICPGFTISSRHPEQATTSKYDLSYPISMDPPNAFHGSSLTPLNRC